MEQQKRRKGMERFVKGDVVIIPFPFSDLTNSKKRPALIITKPIGKDVLLCQITSKINLNEFSIKIKELPLVAGKYSITYNLIGDEGYLDGIEDAIELIVESGDFEGYTEIPPSSHGKYLIKADWL